MTRNEAIEIIRDIAIDVHDQALAFRLLEAIGRLINEEALNTDTCFHGDDRIVPWSGPNDTPDRGLCVQCGDWVKP